MIDGYPSAAGPLETGFDRQVAPSDVLDGPSHEAGIQLDGQGPIGTPVTDSTPPSTCIVQQGTQVDHPAVVSSRVATHLLLFDTAQGGDLLRPLSVVRP